MEEKLGAGAHGRRHRCARADHRRERHRQGAAGARHPQGEPAPQSPVRRRQLQRDGGEPARERAVRARQGRLQRRGHDHRGLFQTAEGGTLLLDEIGDLPMRLQVKLLRVLQENAIRPARQQRRASPINVRVISATHARSAAAAGSGQFREDLYYRLNVVHIEMPPLNRRREDIPVLVAHFLAADRAGERQPQDLRARGRGAAGHQRLARQRAPAAERRAPERARCRRRRSFPVELVQQSLGGTQGKLPSFDEARDEFTRSYLSQILQITGGNVSQAARLAKRNRTDFYKLLGRHQLVPDDFKGHR